MRLFKIALSALLILSLVTWGQVAEANDPNNKIMQEMSGHFSSDGGSYGIVSEVFTIPVVAIPHEFTIKSFEIKLVNPIPNTDNFRINVQSQGSYGTHTNGYFTLYADDVILKSSYGDEYGWYFGYDIIVIPEFKVQVNFAGKQDPYIRMYAYGLTGSSSKHLANTGPCIMIPPSNPVLVLDDIGQTSIEFTITKADNYGAASLQRYSPETNKWVNIATNLRNNHKFKDEGLKPDTTYRYRTVSTATYYGDPSKDITVYNYQGGNHYAEFTTASDPAVVAAQKAENAAQLAKIAAESSMQYSLDAKTEATEAKNKAQEVYDLVSSLELGNVKEDVSFIKNTMSTPVIQSVKGQNNATATRVNHFVLKIRAAGIQDNLRYRVVCDDFDSGWGSSSAVNIHGLTTPGVKTATVMVSNNPDDPDKGSIASGEFTFFKL